MAKKVIRLTENDLHRIVKRVIKEQDEISTQEKGKTIVNKSESAVDSLSDDEKNILSNFIKDIGPEGFKEFVADRIEGEKSEFTEEDDDEYTSDLGMSKDEYKVRKIIDKIIMRVGPLATLGIVPAAMFISGGAAVGLGLTALAGFLLKDAAWYAKKDYSKPMPGSGMRSGGIHYKAAERARKEGF